jgi:hypothetical protein
MCIAQLTFTTTPLTAAGSRHNAVMREEYPKIFCRYKAQKKNMAGKERKPRSRIPRS